MHQTHAVILATLMTLGSRSLPAQTETVVVHIHISAPETCLVDDLTVPCSDVGAKLVELGTPLDGHLDLTLDKNLTYSAASAALESVNHSLGRAGFRLKIGYVNIRDE